ncbi:MAG: hypothetical protein GWM88_01770 [Pseudomonadales bacterium]|nr:hypothetical protein [Pseudomonadales bacterium]NIX06810.1 hypothetical protein [Pseudomonadales bacterium]
MALKLYHPSQRTIGRALTLVVISLLALLLRFLGPLPQMASSTMLLGFLLLAAFVAGELARDIKLPRITGYMVIGILFGPYTLGLVPRQTVNDFRLINEIALSVIALQAGGELHFQRLKERLLSISLITTFQIVITLGGVAAVVFLGRDLFPFLAQQSYRAILAIALIFGLVAVAKSPATTIAVITEMKARGPLTDTVLSVSVLKDVIILLLIAVLLPTATILVDPSRGFDFGQLGEISQAIAISLVLGGVIGWLIGLYLAKVNIQPILFVLGVAFLSIELAHSLELESESFIVMSMAAGFVVQNFSVQGPTFVSALEANSLPLYALFFAVAGAGLRLDVIPDVWRVGLLILVARMVLIYVSTYVGAALSHDLPVIRRYAWMGFLAKAGVTLGLATIVQDRFPPWGEEVAVIIIAMIAVNQLIGPPLFRYSLVRAGEVR